MAQIRRSFDELSRMLSEISDRELRPAIGLVRRRRAGLELNGRLPRLEALIAQLDPDALSWLDTVLCVRLQQAGREAAWRRFAASAYRELLTPGG
jgi:hypothetical protein